LVLACAVLVTGCKSEEAVTNEAAPAPAPSKAVEATDPGTDGQTPLAKSDELSINPNAKATQPGSGL
jgi:hypothetical protein